MAPLWHTFVEPGKTRALLYVVDASSPETVGIATIHLVEMLHAPGIEVKGTQYRCSLKGFSQVAF